jgi:TatA/E family protein of Tat protein translocase
MGPVGLPEMAVIFVIALVLFGPKKLPELGRMLGTAIRHFRRVRSEMKAALANRLMAPSGVRVRRVQQRDFRSIARPVHAVRSACGGGRVRVSMARVPTR